MKRSASLVATACSALALSMLFAVPGCERDATAEVERWKAKSCACQEESCAKEQRREFWRLVREFSDEDPTDAEAQVLARSIDEGEACLAAMSVDIYAAVN